MQTLRDVVGALNDLDDEAIIYTDGTSPAARCAVVRSDAVQVAEDAGLTYFLEVALAKDAVLVWSQWRDGAEPTVDDKLMAVSHYATHDAYMPLD